MSKPAFHRAQPDARRHSLVAATRRVLERDGAAGASVRAIAQEGGVSPGLITHHFGSVDALIAATYADVAARVHDALEAAVAAAGEAPRDRLAAYVLASFDPPIADAALLATWIAFWSLVRTRPAIAALHAEIYGGYRAGLVSLLSDCGVSSAAVQREAIALTALVDGLWLELCLAPETLSAAEAKAIARDRLAALTS